MIEKAYAKINIGLDIVEKRKDGYHNIDTVMQTIALHDTIELTKTASGIEITCSNPNTPTDKTNTVYMAALAFYKKSEMRFSNSGISINIKKRIPSEAGLGGGSSDAAAVLRAMNKMFCTNYGTREMIELALQIGSDVPFLITGGTKRAKGRGEILMPVKSFEGVDTVIVMPNASVSTKQAYDMFKKHLNPEHPDIDKLIETISYKELSKISRLIGNTFESLVFPFEPIIEKAKHDIIKTSPLACSMTGSGSAVYGFYPSANDAKNAYKKLSGKYNTFITKTIGGIS